MSVLTVNIVTEQNSGLHYRLFTRKQLKPNHVKHGGHLTLQRRTTYKDVAQ
jgi:hypothetical protein